MCLAGVLGMSWPSRARRTVPLTSYGEAPLRPVTQDGDEDLHEFERAFPVIAILRAVQLSYKLHNPGDIARIVELSTALASSSSFP